MDSFGTDFIDIPVSARVVACPICRACLNQRQYEYNGYVPECAIFGETPEAVENMEINQCKYFIANKKSVFYEIVEKIMKHEDE